MNSPISQPPTLEPQAPTHLWLLRHAEVEAAYQGIFGGRIDMALSPRGHQQAAALARYLHGRRFDALYASPMQRVQQTLAPVLLNGMPRPVLVPEFQEVDFGDWTGLTWADVQTKFGISALAWLDQLECGGIANAECAETFRARVEPPLRQILTRHSGQQVVIACHGGVIRMMLAILLDWPLSRVKAFEIEYASITEIACTPASSRLQLVNFTPWRELPQNGS